MKIDPGMTDEALLRELGARIAAARLARNLTQAALATQAGISKRTVERLEAGAVAAQLSALIRICRVLGLIERFELLLPETAPGPLAQLELQNRRRQRASSARKAEGPAKPWTWSEP